MRTLGLIPARGGSKRLPGKNVRLLAGKPLVFWTIEAALGSSLDDVWLSTEDANIRDICRDSVRVVDRPLDLASDFATSEAVIAHAVALAEGFDRIMLLQPTSPLRTAAHIDDVLSLGRTCVSVVQDGTTYRRNGAMYLMDADHIMGFDLAYVMSAEESIDIDTQDDFDLAEAMLRNR